MRTPNLFGKLVTFVLSLAVSEVAMVLFFGAELGTLFMVAIFLHEVGHFLVFRYFGYTSGMFFIPLLGAAVSPDNKKWPDEVTDKQLYEVSAVGPLVNVVLMVAGLIMIVVDWHVGFGQALASINALLAAFNLLPFGAFDGGKMTSAIFASADEKHDRAIAWSVGSLALVIMIVVVLVNGFPLILVPVLAWGLNRASLKDDPDACRSRRAMARHVINRYSVAYATMLFGSMIVWAFLPDWSAYWG